MVQLAFQKYEDSFYELDTIESVVVLRLYPQRYPSDKEYLWTRCYGRIVIYKDDDGDNYDKTYYSRIYYNDQLNEDKNSELKLSDI